MSIDDLFLIFAVLIALLVIAGCGDEYRNHTECRKVADLIETQLKNEVYEDERGESTLSDDADGYYAARLAGIE